MAQYVDPNAFGNAFARQVAIGQAQNAFNAQQRQQSIENARTDEVMSMRRQEFQTQQAEQQRALNAQNVQTVAQVAQRALGIKDPAQRKSYLQYAIPAYSQAFHAIGADVQSGLPQMLAMPDGDLQSKLEQVAQLAAPEAPIKTSPGDRIIQRQPGGTYSELYSSPGKVTWEDTGGYKTPIDATTGLQRTDIAPLKKTPTPYQGITMAAGGELTPEGFDLAAQSYRLEGKLPSGIGRNPAIAAKIISRAAQMASADGQDSEAAVLNRNAFLATKKAQASTLQQFTSGKNGNTVRSLNVAVQHLDQLSQLADALDNGNVPLINRLGNAFAKQTGSAAPVTFDAMKKVVTDELVKAIVGAGGGVADREEMAATVNAAQSPAQLRDVVANYKGLMAGQLNGLRQQYEEGTGRQDFERFLLPITKTELEKHDVGTAPGANAPAAGATTNARAPAAGAPVRVSTPEEAMKLPSGTQFVTPDGRLKVRP